MKKQILLFVFVAIATFSFSQTNKNIIVSHNSSNVAYEDLESAIAGAADGATIYVPGGKHFLNTNSIVLDKELHFKGDGYDSFSKVGPVPKLMANITLKRGADNTSFEGLYFTNDIRLDHQEGDEGMFRVFLKTCRLKYRIISTGTSSTTIGNIQLYLQRCVFSGIDLNGCIEKVYVDNCIMTSNIFDDIDEGHIQNSIILEHSSYDLSLSSSENIKISNSILGLNVFDNGDHGNTISNSLLVTGKAVSAYVSSSNIIYADWDDIFENTPSYNAFSLMEDYHLASGSPAVGSGEEGVDMGIYGGAYPWKEHNIPPSPNVYYKSVSHQSNSEGNLNVTYKVKAQSN